MFSCPRRGIDAAILFVLALIGWIAVNAVVSVVVPYRTVPIRELYVHQERWMRKGVRAEGVLRGYSDRRYGTYDVLESDDGYRVVVEGLPAETLAPLMGSRVLVLGKFGFKDGLGIEIAADRISSSTSESARSTR